MAGPQPLQAQRHPIQTAWADGEALDSSDLEELERSLRGHLNDLLSPDFLEDVVHRLLMRARHPGERLARLASHDFSDDLKDVLIQVLEPDGGAVRDPGVASTIFTGFLDGAQYQRLVRWGDTALAQHQETALESLRLNWRWLLARRLESGQERPATPEQLLTRVVDTRSRLPRLPEPRGRTPDQPSDLDLLAGAEASVRAVPCLTRWNEYLERTQPLLWSVTKKRPIALREPKLGVVRFWITEALWYLREERGRHQLGSAAIGAEFLIALSAGSSGTHRSQRQAKKAVRRLHEATKASSAWLQHLNAIRKVVPARVPSLETVNRWFEDVRCEWRERLKNEPLPSSIAGVIGVINEVPLRPNVEPGGAVHARRHPWHGLAAAVTATGLILFGAREYCNSTSALSDRGTTAPSASGVGLTGAGAGDQSHNAYLSHSSAKSTQSLPRLPLASLSNGFETMPPENPDDFRVPLVNDADASMFCSHWMNRYTCFETRADCEREYHQLLRVWGSDLETATWLMCAPTAYGLAPSLILEECECAFVAAPEIQLNPYVTMPDHYEGSCTFSNGGDMPILVADAALLPEEDDGSRLRQSINITTRGEMVVSLEVLQVGHDHVYETQRVPGLDVDPTVLHVGASIEVPAAFLNPYVHSPELAVDVGLAQIGGDGEIIDIVVATVPCN